MAEQEAGDRVTSPIRLAVHRERPSWEAVWFDEEQATVAWLTEKLWPGETTEEAALALCEEAGEVARAVIKRNHQTRHEGDRAAKDWTADLRVELAQVVIVAMKMAEREGFSLWGAVAEQMTVLDERRTRRDGDERGFDPSDEGDGDDR